jgi:Protein of unknown function (DUF2735)
MATGTYRESAKIIAFPKGGRGSAVGFKSQLRSVVDFPAKAMPVVDYEAWYHREAIEDEGKSHPTSVN